MNWSLLQA